MSATAPSRASIRFGPVLWHLAWILPLVALAYPVAGFLWHEWTRSVWTNGHGMMVPALCLVLSWRIIRDHPATDEEPSAWGFALLLPALLLVALDAAINTELLAVVGLLCAAPGLSLLLLGPRRTRALLFPWLLSFFMLPIPPGLIEPVHLALRHVTIDGVAWVLHAMQRTVLIEGFYIYQPKGALWVANECSGFSTLYASVTVALVLCYLSETWRSRLLLVALCFPLAMAANILRITLLSLLVNLPNGKELLDGPLHPASGWMTFMFAFGGLLLVADMRRWRSPSWHGSPAATSPTSPS